MRTFFTVALAACALGAPLSAQHDAKELHQQLMKHVHKALEAHADEIHAHLIHRLHGSHAKRHGVKAHDAKELHQQLMKHVHEALQAHAHEIHSHLVHGLHGSHAKDHGVKAHGSHSEKHGVKAHDAHARKVRAHHDGSDDPAVKHHLEQAHRHMKLHDLHAMQAEIKRLRAQVERLQKAVHALGAHLHHGDRGREVHKAHRVRKKH